jgi:acyl dehydratase
MKAIVLLLCSGTTAGQYARRDRIAAPARGARAARRTAAGEHRPSRVGAPSSQGEPETDMSESNVLETDQAAREASGAHEYGRYLEEFEVGAVYKHWPAKTITESEDHLFCLLTMNHHPLHVNDVYAAKSQQGRNVVAGPYVYSLIFGMSVSDVSGKAIANLATEELSHPAPVFHGDTLFVESEVLEKKESRSKPDRGTVKVHTRAYNQDGVLVAEFKRIVLVPRKVPGGDDASAEGNVD